MQTIKCPMCGGTAILKNTTRKIGTAIGLTAGGWASRSAGAALGSMVCPGAGTIIGWLLGAGAGAMAGHTVGRFIDEEIVPTYVCTGCGHKLEVS